MEKLYDMIDDITVFQNINLILANSFTFIKFLIKDCVIMPEQQDHKKYCSRTSENTFIGPNKPETNCDLSESDDETTGIVECSSESQQMPGNSDEEQGNSDEEQMPGNSDEEQSDSDEEQSNSDEEHSDSESQQMPGKSDKSNFTI